MVLKRYKLKLEFTMNIQELTDEIVHESLKTFSNYNEILLPPEIWDRTERQKRLLRTLLANPEVLEQFVLHEIFDLYEAYAAEQVKAMLATSENRDEILLPIINSMDERDSAVFNELIEDDMLFTYSEQFNDCFSLELTNARITEVMPERPIKAWSSDKK